MSEITIQEAKEIIAQEIENLARRNKEPEWMTRIRYKGLEAFEKAPHNDPVISKDELLRFIAKPEIEGLPEHIESLDDLPPEMKALLDRLGISEVEQKYIAGLAVQTDTGIIYNQFLQEWAKKGLIVLPMEEAVKKYPDVVKRHFLQMFSVNESKMAAYHTAVWNGGIFLYVKEGLKVPFPLHLFFLIQESALAQAPHIIIIAERNTEFHLIEGCTAPVLVRHSLHLDMTEAYIHDGAKVQLTVLQNWPEYVHTRPMTRARIGKNARFINTTVGLGTGRSNIANPKYWVEENGYVELNGIILGQKDWYVDLGGEMYLQGREAAGINASKAVIMEESTVITRGKIVAEAPRTKGHISCDALLMSDKAVMETYPGLVSRVDDAELSHEAAIGKIREEELFYLMSRGLSEEKATQLIVKGFLEPMLKDIPMEFLVEIRKIIELAVSGGM
ncbi:SufD family Fe-S cluster assembly protein [Thermococcus sp. GR7]|uniref:SufD family Fe-S cluster assembly protein n=1 Tax=unclassified Thermococcus TaxID=2627626 RepID=UPI00142F410F|nr:MULTISPECIES: SufD family Fe-S cluster assembly protein [unclassified Thermococcus]NJE46518.1 SufD family Fe-S cluster assembly protein [Thermococcus sp. GR7]NJE77562.1 SufD family Fe-S cluster assembly protein [Thermococcus sp. GR4]NJF23651.1 SufD family Fe-S cluster assembly protein [Thermococcus sp. GR5]